MYPPSLKVAVSILNWNGWQDTLDCLESLLCQPHRELEIIVCDNFSDDDSFSRIEQWCEAQVAADRPGLASFQVRSPKGAVHRQVSSAHRNAGEDPQPAIWLNLVQTGTNLGFARGHNVGIGLALAGGADYVFVLNNDAVVAPSCIADLVAFGQAHPQVALMGPKVLDVDSEVYHQWAVKARLDFKALMFTLTPMRLLVRKARFFRSYYHMGEAPGPVYSIPGSAMMFKQGTLQQIGGFDEYTFLYWEEFIVAERLHQLGLTTWLVPQAVVRHKVGASINKIGARKFMEGLRSERYFFRTYLPLTPIQRRTLDFVRLGAYLLRCFVHGDYRRNLLKFLRVLIQK